MAVPTPQETDCTDISIDSEGVANGVLSMIAKFYDVQYNEDEGTYEVQT